MNRAQETQAFMHCGFRLSFMMYVVFNNMPSIKTHQVYFSGYHYISQQLQSNLYQIALSSIFTSQYWTQI